MQDYKSLKVWEKSHIKELNYILEEKYIHLANQLLEIKKC